MSVNEWHKQGQFIPFKSIKLFAAASGSPANPPILALHGFPTASYDYARIVPLLVDQFYVVAFDFPGFGFSDKPTNYAYSIFDHADAAETIANHYGIDQRPFTLLMHDMGDSVGLELLKRKSLPVNQIVMLNGSVLLKYYQPLITQRLLLHPIMGKIITGLGLIKRGTFARQFGSVFASPPPEAEIDEFWNLVTHNHGDKIYHLLIRYLNERALHEYTWLDALKTHPAPLTILWGERDPVSVSAIADAVKTYRPDARDIRLPEIGHYPQWEAPETIAAVIQGLENGT